MRVSAQVHHEYRRTELRGDELLITLVGKPGACIIARPQMRGWNVARALAVVRLQTPSLRPYVKAVLESSVMKSIILGMLNTTVQPTLNLKEIKSLPVPLPEDEKIGGSIGGVSELFNQRIDLLRQTNATLESIAQALFRSWFIDFDPVRAKQAGREPEGMDAATAALFPAEFEESAPGLIPKGWKVGTVRDVCSIYDSRRVPLSGKDRATRRGPYPYYGAAALMDYVDDFLFDGVYLLLGEDGSVTNANGTPVTQYVWGKFWVNNHAHVLQGANGICTEHLMLGLRDVDFTPYVTGAVQAKLNQANLFRVPFLISTLEASKAFESEVAPLYEKLRSNLEQIQMLAEIRDTLLPRLISGKLRLPEAQEQLEDALA